MAWTPELDECETAAGGTFCSGGSGFTFPDDEGKVEAVFEKNLDFARNVAATTLDRDRPDRPRNATDDETQYQVKGSPDIEPNRFDVSFGAEQTLEATARRILGPVDFVVQAQTGPGGNSRTLTLRAQPWRGGERFGDLRGKYYQRVRAAVPASFTQPGTTQTPRPLVAGDVVNVRVIAGSQQQRFSYRVQSTRPAGDAKRVLVVAAEDYTGLSPNKLPYDDAPRYLDAHVAALEANGYAVETFDVDAPPLGPDGEPGAKLVNDLGVLSHFDAVVFYTGDDLVPQAPGEGVTAENFRRGGPATGGAFALTGSTHLTNWGVRNAHMLRNFMNDGGKVLLAGRNLWVQQTAYQTAFNPPPQQGGLNSYSGYSWWQDPVYDFDYPPNQAGDDDRPHTAFFRELDMPNDWGQWWLGFGHRTGGAGTTTLNAAAVEPAAGGILAGMGPIALDTSLGSGGTLEPTEDAVTGRADPRPKAPTRLRAISTQILPPATQRPFRQETIQADYAGQPNAFGGAVISTRDSVSVGIRARADHRPGGPRGARRPGDGVPAARRRGHDRSDGDLAAAGRRRDGGRRRPGRDRGRAGRRARRHAGGPPRRRRRGRADEGLVPVPAALAAGTGRRRGDQDADGRGRGRGRQRDHVGAHDHGRPCERAGGGAATDRCHDACGYAGGGRDADLRPVGVHGRRHHARLCLAA